MTLRELHNLIAGAIGRLRGGTSDERNDLSTIELLVAEGRARLPTGRLVLPEPRPSESGLTTEQILAEDREDRL